MKKTVNQNLLYFDTDSKDNVYAVFRHQNRIDKYSTDGDLKIQSDRKLNYEIEYTYRDDHKNLEGVPLDYAQHDFTTVSTGIAVDIKDRVWVSTYRTQTARRPWEKFEFEIFNDEGVLLTKIPFPERVFGKFRISGDKMFCIDDDNKCVYIYRIVERE
ncbi:MAG: hypothetical protein GY863_13955 [bacterium]|nr:hypothetical protein [bacterium]